jgi:hypothetical protein
MLCLLTAAGLAVLSISVMVARYRILGDEINVQSGPGTWKVTLLVHGKITRNDARLTTSVPLDFGRQHVSHEICHSSELWPKPPDAKYPERHHVLWSPRPGVAESPFRAVYQFFCAVNVRSPSSPMSTLARTVYAAPQPGRQLASEQRIESDHADISSTARRLTHGVDDVRDQLDALFRYVDQEVANEPAISGETITAVDCLRNGGGDSAAKSRLLVALCRNRGIPARMVTGLALRHGHQQKAHSWVEAWVHDHWASACPSYHYLGRVPATYVVLSYGDMPIVRGRGLAELDHAFLVEHPGWGEEAAGSSGIRSALIRLSLYSLPPAEQRLVEFLLLLPIAALVVCIYRNLIGLNSFGTFAPALVGLAFRDLGGLPGILVFVSIVLVGWIMRRILDSYHLLQVPRMAFLLSLVVIVLISLILTANYRDLPATKYISVFPMVILTGMIERFWTLEAEDGTSSSFQTLLGTLVIAISISLLFSLHAIVRHMFRFPETLGLVMAMQLVIGRYTGYRLSELFRFREFLRLQARGVVSG